MRSYTVAEIDDLRSVVRDKNLYGNYNGSYDRCRSHSETDVVLEVEAVVRTHMLAGHDADQLRASDPPKSGDREVFTSSNGRVTREIIRT